MAWTTPKTWEDDELVTAALMNTHIRDNLNALKVPAATAYTGILGGSTTSGAFVNVDPTNLSLTITTTGGAVLIGFVGSVSWTGSHSALVLDVDVDGARIGDATNGLVIGAGTQSSTVPYNSASFVVRKSGLSAGSHTFKLQFKRLIGAGTGVAKIKGIQNL